MVEVIDDPLTLGGDTSSMTRENRRLQPDLYVAIGKGSESPWKALEKS